MGIFHELMFQRLARREELIARAEQVGNLEDVLELGIMATQLGLTRESLEKLARLYVTGTHWND